MNILGPGNRGNSAITPSNPKLPFKIHSRLLTCDPPHVGDWRLVQDLLLHLDPRKVPIRRLWYYPALYRLRDYSPDDYLLKVLEGC